VPADQGGQPGTAQAPMVASAAQHAGTGPGTVPPDPARGFKRMLSELADLGAFGPAEAQGEAAP